MNLDQYEYELLEAIERTIKFEKIRHLKDEMIDAKAAAASFFQTNTDDKAIHQNKIPCQQHHHDQRGCKDGL